MSTNVAKATVRAHEKSLLGRLNEVNPTPARVRTAERTEEIAPKKRRGGSIAREAMRSGDVSVEAFRIDAGQKSDGVVSESLSGTRHLPLDWVLDQTSEQFRVAFVDALRQHWGLVRQSKRAIRMKVAADLMQLIFDLDSEEDGQ